MTLKHRPNFGAHTANMSVDGYPVDRHLGYYRERAIGGAAMIVVEPVPVHHSSVLTRGNFRCEDDSVIPSPFVASPMPCVSMARSSSKRSAVAPRRALRGRRSMGGGDLHWPCKNRALAAHGQLCRIIVRGRK